MNLSEQQVIAAGMDQWITGITGRIPGLSIFVENPEHVQYAKEIAGEHSILFVLGGDREDDAVVPVCGHLDAAGDELLVGDGLALEIQDYVAVPFLNLIGVTIVRTTTPQDWTAFFDDAEEARQSGYFVSQLTETNAVLAERGILGASISASSSPARLHIASDGTVLNGFPRFEARASRRLPCRTSRQARRSPAGIRFRRCM